MPSYRTAPTAARWARSELRGVGFVKQIDGGDITAFLRTEVERRPCPPPACDHEIRSARQLDRDPLDVSPLQR